MIELSLTFDQLLSGLDALNSRLESLSLTELLQWCASLSDIAQVTSFGSSGMVIIHELRNKLHSNLPVIFVDTLHHFQETIDFADRVSDVYDLNLHTYHCSFADTQKEFEEKVGDTQLWLNNPQQYDYHAKVEPLERALQELDIKIWITGRRRDQGGDRKSLPIVEIDPSDGRIKVNPLANWSSEDVWTYLKNNHVMWNPLHERGYKSIGDKMTTRPVSKDESERSGRFYQIPEKTECGIHNRPKNWKRNLAASAPTTAAVCSA